ncbi:MAG: radical SAM protein [Phycisphaerales bacterium]
MDLSGLIASRPEALKSTTSRCPRCHREIPADVIRRGTEVWMAKSCPDHGRFEVRLTDDARRYHVSVGRRDGGCGGGACGCEAPIVRASDAPGRGAPEPPADAAPIVDGVAPNPMDLLPSCVALIEIVDSCNLTCPTCYASSPFGIGDEVAAATVEEVIARIGGVLDRKGTIDILQLSGGEPSIHPRFFEILEWALDQRRIGYVLINTNGVRIATDAAFRERLGALRRQRGRFELYLQFDGPQEAGQRELRGADLRETRRRAVDEAGALGVPTTLAMVVTPTTIDHLGDALRFGVERPHVRGITFQPVFASGRLPDPAPGRRDGPAVALPVFEPTPTPIAVADVIRAVVAQAPDLAADEDFTPLPCGDPNCHTIAYLLRLDGPSRRTVGLNRLVDLPAMQGFLANRLDYRIDDLLRCGCETEPLGEVLKALEIGPDRPFRVFIKPFMDAWTFDQDRIDRCCTHVIRRDGSLDSFCRHYLDRGR